MGVPGLIGVLERVCGHNTAAKRTVSVAELRVMQDKAGERSVLAVDAMNLLFYLAGLDGGRGLEAELEAFCESLRESGLRAVCVFDSAQMSRVRQQRANVRRQQRTEALGELKMLEPGHRFIPFAERRREALLRSRSVFVDAAQVMAARDMLSKSGVCTVFVAPDEADSVCVDFVEQGIAFACLSNDSDMFVQGCRTVLRRYCPGREKDDGAVGATTFELWDTAAAQGMFGLNAERFRLICESVVAQAERTGHNALYKALMDCEDEKKGTAPPAVTPRTTDVWPRAQSLPLRVMA